MKNISCILVILNVSMLFIQSCKQSNNNDYEINSFKSLQDSLVKKYDNIYIFPDNFEKNSVVTIFYTGQKLINKNNVFLSAGFDGKGSSNWLETQTIPMLKYKNEGWITRLIVSEKAKNRIVFNFKDDRGNWDNEGPKEYEAKFLNDKGVKVNNDVKLGTLSVIEQLKNFKAFSDDIFIYPMKPKADDLVSIIYKADKLPGKNATNVIFVYGYDNKGSEWKGRKEIPMYKYNNWWMVNFFVPKETTKKIVFNFKDERGNWDNEGPKDNFIDL